MSKRYFCLGAALVLTIVSAGAVIGQDDHDYEYWFRGRFHEGRRLFERETFGGNGRTCQTCHSEATGTVSPEDARQRFAYNKRDPLFVHDGSDDGFGHGVQRMLKDATILVTIDLPQNVSLADDPTARSVTLRRGIPTTLNTPALDPVLMLDGREPNLESQARNAIRNHAESEFVSHAEARRIASFEQTAEFFSSRSLRRFAHGGPAPELPPGHSESEVRGRRFFVDGRSAEDPKVGICSICHSGPMLNTTNQFAPPPIRAGLRFQTILVSEFNAANNPIHEFIFENPDGSKTSIKSPDPGRALITGESQNKQFDNVNAFKIPTLWGVRDTAPYFHDNSAKTLKDVAAHYAKFFKVVTAPNSLLLTEQDQQDMVAYLKLLD
jgi:cytochrome c peroxidase